MIASGAARASAASAMLSLLTGVVFGQATQSANLNEAEPILRIPAVDYRKDWVQLGVYSLLADDPQDGAQKIQAIYTEGKNVEAYLKSGKFPDGAVLVKDVWTTKTEAMTNGTASYEDKLEGRFTMVKDGSGKLGTGPRFGDGWGWAYFPGEETTKTETVDYKSDCLGCHEPARQTDLIHPQGYSALRYR